MERSAAEDKHAECAERAPENEKSKVAKSILRKESTGREAALDDKTKSFCLVYHCCFCGLPEYAKSPSHLLKIVQGDYDTDHKLATSHLCSICLQHVCTNETLRAWVERTQNVYEMLSAT